MTEPKKIEIQIETFDGPVPMNTEPNDEIPAEIGRVDRLTLPVAECTKTVERAIDALEQVQRENYEVDTLVVGEREYARLVGAVFHDHSPRLGPVHPTPDAILEYLGVRFGDIDLTVVSGSHMEATRQPTDAVAEYARKQCRGETDG